MVSRETGRPFVAGQVSTGYIAYPGYEHLKWEAIVQTMEPERLFSFTWHPYAVDPQKDYSKETPTLVEFRLEKTANGTLLILTESGFDKVPSDRRLEAFRMNEGGWTRANEKHRELCRTETVAPQPQLERLTRLSLRHWAMRCGSRSSQSSVAESPIPFPN